MDKDNVLSNLPPVKNTGSDAVPSEPVGGSHHAIFTPQPDPTEPAGSPMAPGQPSANLSHPYFSNHPTQTFNTEAGDIILNTGAPKPKQSKRPFIIGGIIVVFIVALAVSGWALLSGKRGKNETVNETQAPIVTDELKNAYNAYVNLLFFGKNTEENLIPTAIDNGTFETDEIYAEKMISSVSDDRENYFNALNNTFLVFKNIYEECHFTDSIDEISDYFFKYAIRNEYTLSELISLYLTKGKEEALSEVNARFALSTSNAALARYLENQKKTTEIEILLIEAANQAGCIKSGTFDEVCIAAHQDSFRDINQGELSDYMAAAFDAVLELKAEAFAKVYEVYDKIFDGVIEKSGESVK